MAKRVIKSRKKTYRKKGSAKRAAHGRSVYKVRGGWRLAKAKRKRRRRKRSGNPGVGCGLPRGE